LRRCGKKFKSFYLTNCNILAYIRIDKNPFFGHPKKQAAALHKVIFA